MVAEQVGQNFDGQSIHSDMSYKLSAIGEMNNNQLEQLMDKNQKKIESIEQKYFAANAGIKTAKEIMKEQQETFEIKEKFKDASINYPTYGRGLEMPGIELNTFMVNEKMCADNTKKKR